MLPDLKPPVPVAGRDQPHRRRPKQIESAHVQHVDPQVRPVAADHRPEIQGLQDQERRGQGGDGQQHQGGMGQGAVAEAPFQRHRQPPEQPADPGGGQVHVGQQAGAGGQRPADDIGPVAEQGRAAQVEDGGEGDVGAEGREIGPTVAATRPVPTVAASGLMPRRPAAEDVGRPRPSAARPSADSSATSVAPTRKMRTPGPGAQQEEQPGSHDEDAAADGEDFLVRVRAAGSVAGGRSAPGSAGPAGPWRTDASVVGGYRTCATAPAGRDKVGGRAQGGALFGPGPARRFVNSPAPPPGTGTPAPRSPPPPASRRGCTARCRQCR